MRQNLEKEAEEKFKVNNEDKGREHYYDRMWFKAGYIAGAEPRENKIADIKANCDLAIEGRDIKIKELEEENRQLKNEVEDLRAYCNQIGKVKTEVMKAFEYIVAR